MIKKILFTLLSICVLQSCSEKDGCQNEKCAKSQANQSQDIMKAKNNDTEISCKLTTPELKKRKETVIANLKSKILEKKELADGYSYKFAGTDAIIDELAEFVKSERACCSFFTFGLSFSGDGTEAWLNLTGPEGAKEMITNELNM
jgi:hypothetical protein